MHNKEILEICFTSLCTFCFNPFLTNTVMSLILFSFETWPLELISKGTSDTLSPWASRSDFNGVYFVVLYAFAELLFCSRLHVSSSKRIFFSALFKMTMSGFCVVVKISGGIFGSIEVDIMVMSHDGRFF